MVHMKNLGIILLCVAGLVSFVFIVQTMYLRYSNTLQVLEHTNTAVQVCGEGNVKFVTPNGFECNSDPSDAPYLAATDGQDPS